MQKPEKNDNYKHTFTGEVTVQFGSPPFGTHLTMCRGNIEIEVERMAEIKKPVMYIFINKGLGMSAGKMAAQAGHAAVEAYRLTMPPMLEAWYRGKHYTKIVLEAENEQRLYTIREYLQARGFKTELIIDEGMTEIDAHQATALGVAVVDRADPHTHDTFSSFHLYQDTVKVTLEIKR